MQSSLYCSRMSSFTSKKIWKFFIQIQLTKSNPKITRGVKVPCFMPIRVKECYLVFQFTQIHTGWRHGDKSKLKVLSNILNFSYNQRQLLFLKHIQNKNTNACPLCISLKKLALSKDSRNIKIDITKTDIISVFTMRFKKKQTVGRITDLDFICHRDMMMVRGCNEQRHGLPKGAIIFNVTRASL